MCHFCSVSCQLNRQLQSDAYFGIHILVSTRIIVPAGLCRSLIQIKFPIFPCQWLIQEFSDGGANILCNIFYRKLYGNGPANTYMCSQLSGVVINNYHFDHNRKKNLGLMVLNTFLVPVPTLHIFETNKQKIHRVIVALIKHPHKSKKLKDGKLRFCEIFLKKRSVKSTTPVQSSGRG